MRLYVLLYGFLKNSTGLLNLVTEGRLERSYSPFVVLATTVNIVSDRCPPMIRKLYTDHVYSLV